VASEVGSFVGRDVPRPWCTNGSGSVGDDGVDAGVANQLQNAG
jgi:hypothetical protein